MSVLTEKAIQLLRIEANLARSSWNQVSTTKVSLQMESDQPTEVR
ncbi:hypothetical protein QFZ31_005291 [Neobacillus niacini]|nr:hypothetical protein [Neobacillus niacini]MDQ0975413.1 hypothetical protein [Neobacillus niacini]